MVWSFQRSGRRPVKFRSFDPRPQGIDVEHPLHRRQGGVGGRSRSADRCPRGLRLPALRLPLITIPGCAPITSPSSARVLRLLRGGPAAALRRRVGGRRGPDVHIDMLEMLPPLGVWCAPRWRPTTPRSSRSAARSRRPGPIPGPGSSAMSLWAGRLADDPPGATTPSSMRVGTRSTAHSAFRARAAGQRRRGGLRRLVQRPSALRRYGAGHLSGGRWSSATAMSRSTWPASW